MWVLVPTCGKKKMCTGEGSCGNGGYFCMLGPLSKLIRIIKASFLSVREGY